MELAGISGSSGNQPIEPIQPTTAQMQQDFKNFQEDIERLNTMHGYSSLDAFLKEDPTAFQDLAADFKKVEYDLNFLIKNNPAQRRDAQFALDSFNMSNTSGGPTVAGDINLLLDPKTDIVTAEKYFWTNYPAQEKLFQGASESLNHITFNS